MINNVKALIVVLAIAATIFVLAKPVVLTFTAEKDFVRRRNTWCFLTILAFLSPSFWLFAAIATPLFVWVSRRDSNPVALYLFMFQVVPPISVNIPVLGIHELFSLDINRLLSLSVLVPEAWVILTSRRNFARIHWGWMDVLLLAFGMLNILLFVRPDLPNAAALHDSITNVMRRAVLFTLDVYVLYFVVSRSCSTRIRIVDAMGSFCLMGTIWASIAMFESARHWLLYAEMGKNWGEVATHYTIRDDVVRAAASAGDSLSLGYLLAIALGFWLYLKTFMKSRWHRIGSAALLILGLISAYARGPWTGALLIFFAFAILRPHAGARLIRYSVGAAIVIAIVMVSPLGGRIRAVVPFLGGQVDHYNITYRERLLDRSIEMISQHPWLGDQDAYGKLQDLRQGVGVIDFVNTYADVAVFYGLIGLSLFVGFMFLGLLKVWRIARRAAVRDPLHALLGASIVACILGTFMMIYTSSFIFAYAKMYYVVAGLAFACANVGARSRFSEASSAANMAHARVDRPAGRPRVRSGIR